MITLLLLFAATPIAIEATPLETALAAALEAEAPGSLAGNAEAAIRVRLDALPNGALSLEIRQPPDTLLLRREIAAEDGLEPAIRVAVLLIVRAAAQSQAAEAERGAKPPRVAERRKGTRSPRSGRSQSQAAEAATASVAEARATLRPIAAAPAAEEASPIGWSISGMLRGRTWARPDFPPQLGAELALDLTWRAIFFGLNGAFGLGSRATAEVDPASATELSASAEAGWWVLRGEGYAAGVMLAAGFESLRGDAAPKVFAGPGTPAHFSAERAIVDLGLIGALPVADRLEVVLRGGVRLTPTPIDFALPAGFGSGTAPLDPGTVGAFLTLGVAFSSPPR